MQLDGQGDQEAPFVRQLPLQKLAETGAARTAGTERRSGMLAYIHGDEIPRGGLRKRAGVALRTAATSHVSPRTESRFPSTPRLAKWTTAMSWSPGSRLHVPCITFPDDGHPVVTMRTRR